MTLPQLAPAPGLKLSENLTYEEWVRELHKLKEVQKHWKAYVGDAVRFGRRKFGDRVVNATLLQMEFNLTDVRKSEATASVPLERREEFSALDSEHFYIVGKKVEGAKEQETWLRTAVVQKLTGRELELSIDQGATIKLNTNSKTAGRGSGGIRTLHATMYEIEQWMAMIGDGWRDWEENHKKEFLDITEKFAKMRDEVAMSLAKSIE